MMFLHVDQIHRIPNVPVGSICPFATCVPCNLEVHEYSLMGVHHLSPAQTGHDKPILVLGCEIKPSLMIETLQL